MDREIISVTELNLYVKSRLDEDFLLSGLFVRGEISNFKRYSSGHCYFTLKDEHCAVKAVMFRYEAQKLAFAPEDGMKVIAIGRVSVYERDGQYQLYVSDLQPDGIGSLHVAYEQLKSKLETEGLFAEERKRPIPKFPARIGVITSPTGAAVRDIINITGRRFPSAEIVVYPAIVQGTESVPTLLGGLDYFCKTNRADVIIIGRGGGSIEDLWSFNDERVVRAVASATVPVISAVGHETDFTLCDFAADLRAPTPSAAAECATPDCAELASRLAATEKRLAGVTDKALSTLREKLNRISSSRVLMNPQNYIDEKRMAIDSLCEKLTVLASASINEKKSDLRAISAKLDALSPLAVLGRGYGAVFDENEKVVKSINQINQGDSLTIRIKDGCIKSTVASIEKLERKKQSGKEKTKL